MQPCTAGRSAHPELTCTQEVEPGTESGFNDDKTPVLKDLRKALGEPVLREKNQACFVDAGCPREVYVAKSMRDGLPVSPIDFRSPLALWLHRKHPGTGRHAQTIRLVPRQHRQSLMGASAEKRLRQPTGCREGRSRAGPRQAAVPRLQRAARPATGPGRGYLPTSDALRPASSSRTWTPAFCPRKRA